MLTPFNAQGILPPGIHWVEWGTLVKYYGRTEHRRMLIDGLGSALQALQKAGCSVVYIDGSFVTAKDEPGDYDGCWDTKGVNLKLMDPVFFDFNDSRKNQKLKYKGEFFPAQMFEGKTGMIFLEFFQTDKNSGARKGIVGLRLR